MNEKQAHDLAVVMAKNIMGKDYREQNAIKYAYGKGSKYSQNYSGEYNNIVDALRAAEDDIGSDLTVGMIVWVGEIEEAGIGIDVEWLLEDIGDRAYSEFGECAEDYLTDVTSEHQSILEDELNAVFYKWAEKYNYRPHFYTVKNEKAYVYDGSEWRLK